MAPLVRPVLPLALLVACTPPPMPAATDPLLGARAADRLLDEVLTLQPSTFADSFGITVAVADLNADGFGDLLTGDPFGENAFQYLGGPTGLDPASELVFEPLAGYVDGNFGGAVAALGDVDGDGYGDAVVGSAFEDVVGNASGAAYVYRGGPDGLDPTTEQRIVPPDAREYDRFGTTLAGPGDLDGDGYADLVVGAIDAGPDGAVYVFRGGPSGIEADTAVRLSPEDEPAWATGAFGVSLAGAGDVDGDGDPDLVICADLGARLYLNDGSGFAPGDVLPDPAARCVAAAGDVNADGFSDLVVGSATAGVERASIYFGSATGLDLTTAERLDVPEVNPGDDFGSSVAAGDVDGDGYADVVVGAPDFDGVRITNSGSAYVWFGAAAGVEPGASRLVTATSWDDERFGFALAVGDVDGDGRGEVLAGAPHGTPTEGSVTVFGPCLSPQDWYPDGDHDGHGDAGGDPVASCIAVYDHVLGHDDCDDEDGRQWSGNEEVCDGHDNDCDGEIDDDPEDGDRAYRDADGDGHGDPRETRRFCGPPGEGYTTVTGDCDDTEALAWEGLPEVCDGVDNDCDRGTDEQAIDERPFFADADGDGHGDPDTEEVGCPTPGSAAAGDDCDDADPERWRGDPGHCRGPSAAPESKKGCDTSGGAPGVLAAVLALAALRRQRADRDRPRNT